MIAAKRICFLTLACALVAGALEFGEQLSILGFHGVISRAEAVVGRPLTPVSVAGVALRTSRRCAAGVYDC